MNFNLNTIADLRNKQKNKEQLTSEEIEKIRQEYKDNVTLNLDKDIWEIHVISILGDEYYVPLDIVTNYEQKLFNNKSAEECIKEIENLKEYFKMIQFAGCCINEMDGPCKRSEYKPDQNGHCSCSFLSCEECCPINVSQETVSNFFERDVIFRAIATLKIYRIVDDIVMESTQSPMYATGQKLKQILKNNEFFNIDNKKPKKKKNKKRKK